jgi:hypothetical protein
MDAGRTVTVFGAYGHTGRFVVAELLERGLTPILVGRDPGRLGALLVTLPMGLEARPAFVEDADSLDAALYGATAVINCAGPFADTAAPVIEAALRARIPYVDIAAEIEAVADTLAHFDARAREAGTAVVPGMAFHGGLGDLLATAALAELPSADEVFLAYALSSWHPTPGTRASGRVSRQRRGDRRPVYTDGRLELRTGQAPAGRWRFPEPVGERDVLEEFTTADSVTIPHHLTAPVIHTCMTVEAVRDLAAPDTPPPTPADASGRSAQTFLVDVVVRSGTERRRAVARGRDIYATSALLAVEAVVRLLDGRVRNGRVRDGRARDEPNRDGRVLDGRIRDGRAHAAGAASAGEMFDAVGFLRSLSGRLSFSLV